MKHNWNHCCTHKNKPPNLLRKSSFVKMPFLATSLIVYRYTTGWCTKRHNEYSRENGFRKYCVTILLISVTITLSFLLYVHQIYYSVPVFINYIFYWRNVSNSNVCCVVVPCLTILFLLEMYRFILEKYLFDLTDIIKKKIQNFPCT